MQEPTEEMEWNGRRLENSEKTYLVLNSHTTQKFQSVNKITMKKIRLAQNKRKRTRSETER